MKDKEFERWSTYRQKGKARFIFENGLAAWGIPMMVVMGFVNNPFMSDNPLSSVSIHIVTWCIGGLLFGAAMWAISESRYKKALAARANEVSE